MSFNPIEQNLHRTVLKEMQDGGALVRDVAGKGVQFRAARLEAPTAA